MSLCIVIDSLRRYQRMTGIGICTDDSVVGSCDWSIGLWIILNCKDRWRWNFYLRDHQDTQCWYVNTKMKGEKESMAVFWTSSSIRCFESRQNYLVSGKCANDLFEIRRWLGRVRGSLHREYPSAQRSRRNSREKENREKKKKNFCNGVGLADSDLADWLCTILADVSPGSSKWGELWSGKKKKRCVVDNDSSFVSGVDNRWVGERIRPGRY